MRTALLLAAAVLATGCGSLQKKEPPPKPFVGTKWAVQLEVPLQGTPPWVRFGDGLMEGFGGCNAINARYQEDTVGSRGPRGLRLRRPTWLVGDQDHRRIRSERHAAAIRGAVDADVARAQRDGRDGSPSRPCTKSPSCFRPCRHHAATAKRTYSAARMK